MAARLIATLVPPCVQLVNSYFYCTNRLVPGKKADDPCAWAVELEDYLLGVSFLPAELSRLCVVAVIAEDYTMPSKISKFVSDLFGGFRLLNLKNDFLRKRFDSIKYDVKKIEEILYDINIRQLASSSKQESTEPATAPGQV